MTVIYKHTSKRTGKQKVSIRKVRYRCDAMKMIYGLQSSKNFIDFVIIL